MGIRRATIRVACGDHSLFSQALTRPPTHIRVCVESIGPRDQILRRSWLLRGRERIRRPVAAKMALQTAGATIATGGSPIPPQKPPDGTMMVSTLGIRARRNIS